MCISYVSLSLIRQYSFINGLAKRSKKIINLLICPDKLLPIQNYSLLGALVHPHQLLLLLLLCVYLSIPLFLLLQFLETMTLSP